MGSDTFRVLGIDPGSINTGYGCVETVGNRFAPISHGVIKAGSSSDPVASRLDKIDRELRYIMKEVRPAAVSIEEAFYGKNVKAAFRIGEVRGIAILAATQLGIEVFQYSPAVVKKSVVGNGNAHKTQVLEMVRMILGIREEKIPLDASDALAMAVCHCHRLGTEKLLGQALGQ